MPIEGTSRSLAASEAVRDRTSMEDGTRSAGRLQLDDSHRELLDGEFWRKIPAYADLTAAEFHDHRFQSRNCVTSVHKLRQVLGGLVSEAFHADVEAGLRRSTMSLRVSPYLVSLVDWTAAETDPIRIQFLPLGSRHEADHPELALDSLSEQADSPVPGLTHRYHDRAPVPGPRHLSRLLPVLHAFVLGRPEHGGRGQGPLRRQPGTLGAGLRIHPPHPRDRGRGRQRRRHVQPEGGAGGAARPDPAGHRARPEVPIRHQGSGGDAPEAGHRS